MNIRTCPIGHSATDVSARVGSPPVVHEPHSFYDQLSLLRQLGLSP